MSKLWYTRPAGTWGEALPLGNGRLGAMVFGNVWKERIQLNEDTLWAGGPDHPTNPDTLSYLPKLRQLIFDGKYDEAEALATHSFMGSPPRQASYQPLGDLWIEIPAINRYESKDYYRELDIDKAMTYVSFKARGTTYTRRCVICPVNQVLAVHLTADGPEGLNVNFYASSGQPTSRFVAEDGEGVLSGKNGPSDGVSGALRFEARFAVTTDGKVTSKGDFVSITGATWATIRSTMATSHSGFQNLTGDPAAITKDQLAKCAAKSFETIAQEAAAKHQSIFRRVSLDLGETSASKLPTDQRLAKLAEGDDDPSLLALYFQYGRYLLICSSRPGTQPATLQGIWNDSTEPPWDSKYTININIQMNYWAADPGGMPEMFEPLLRFVEQLAVAGRETAKVMYGARGWVAHHNTDLWRATAPIDLPKHGLWPMGGAWFCQHLWNHYDYIRRPALLERIYPVMEQCCLFFVDALVEHPTSKYLVTCPTTSPENIHGINGSDTALCAGPAMDNQILHELFTNTLQAASLLKKDLGELSVLQSLLPKLRPTQIGRDGRIQEWADYVEKEPEWEHRHTSHLYALFPGTDITLETTPELAAAAKKTLEARGEPGTGWATAWRINLWARLREAENAHELVRDLVSKWTMPNLFDLHPPLGPVSNPVFQIDGNFGGVSGVIEMLVQSRPNGEILLLPALPSAWKNGHVTGLNLRGLWSVDIEWRGGKLHTATLKANMSDTRTVSYGTEKKTVTLESGKEAVLDQHLN